jgi:hypothetical protein
MNVKFMQTIERDVFRQLRETARERGVSVQELMRAVIVPEWMAGYRGKPHADRATRTQRKLVTA